MTTIEELPDEGLSDPDHSEPNDSGASRGVPFGNSTPVPKRSRLWMAIVLRVLGILAIIYFVPD